MYKTNRRFISDVPSSTSTCVTGRHYPIHWQGGGSVPRANLPPASIVVVYGIFTAVINVTVNTAGFEERECM